MAYKPYKMKGHALPGIYQRASGTSTDQGTDNLPDGRSASSPLQAKTKFLNKVKSVGKTIVDVAKQEWKDPSGHAAGDSLPERISGSYKKHKKQYRRETEKKKSPAKCPLVAALAPMAMQMIGGAMKSKEPKPNN